jgi:hypothetical protein
VFVKAYEAVVRLDRVEFLIPTTAEIISVARLCGIHRAQGVSNDERVLSCAYDRQWMAIHRRKCYKESNRGAA